MKLWRLDILGIIVICGGYVVTGGNPRWALGVAIFALCLSELLLRIHRYLEAHPTVKGVTRNALSTIAWVVSMNGVIALGALLAFGLCIWLSRT